MSIAVIVLHVWPTTDPSCSQTVPVTNSATQKNQARNINATASASLPQAQNAHRSQQVYNQSQLPGPRQLPTPGAFSAPPSQQQVQNQQLPQGQHVQQQVPSQSAQQQLQQQTLTQAKRAAFVKSLIDLMNKRGTPITSVPMVGDKAVDIYRLYCSVMAAGGSDRIEQRNAWDQVAAKAGLPALDGFEPMRSSPEIAQAIAEIFRNVLRPFEEAWLKSVQPSMINNQSHDQPTQHRGQLQPAPSLVQNTEATPALPKAPQRRAKNTQAPKNLSPLPPKPAATSSSAAPNAIATDPQNVATTSSQAEQMQSHASLYAALTQLPDEQLQGLNLTPEQIAQVRLMRQQNSQQSVTVVPQSSTHTPMPVEQSPQNVKVTEAQKLLQNNNVVKASPLSDIPQLASWIKRLMSLKAMPDSGWPTKDECDQAASSYSQIMQVIALAKRENLSLKYLYES